MAGAHAALLPRRHRPHHKKPVRYIALINTHERLFNRVTICIKKVRETLVLVSEEYIPYTSTTSWLCVITLIIHTLLMLAIV